MEDVKTGYQNSYFVPYWKTYDFILKFDMCLILSACLSFLSLICIDYRRAFHLAYVCDMSHVHVWQMVPEDYLKYHKVEQWCNTPIFAVVIEFQPNSHSFVGDYRLWTRASMKTTSAISTHVLVLLWPFLILMLKMLKNLRSKSVTTLFFLDIWGERDQLYWHIQQRR